MWWANFGLWEFGAVPCLFIGSCYHWCIKHGSPCHWGHEGAKVSGDVSKVIKYLPHTILQWSWGRRAILERFKKRMRRQSAPAKPFSPPFPLWTYIWLPLSTCIDQAPLPPPNLGFFGGMGEVRMQHHDLALQNEVWLTRKGWDLQKEYPPHRYERVSFVPYNYEVLQLMGPKGNL